MPAKQWCDLWHTHFDWEGFGNGGWLHRRRHLSALLFALSRARAELASHPGQYQLFALIDPSNSADDSLYVHTPNPNGTEFPCTFEEAAPVSALPPPFQGLVDPRLYQVFRVQRASSARFLVVPRDEEPNPSIERTVSGKPETAAHVER
jgi:hypothetical protein